MTPAILLPLFEQWRRENKSFCVSSENYNKSNALIESNGKVLTFRYPNSDLLVTAGKWIETHNYSGDVPQYLPKWQIDEIAKVLIASLKPTTCVLQVTSFCNYHCPMCPWHGKGNGFKDDYWKRNPQLKSVHMPLELAKKAVDRILEYGITRIGLTPQGEFFLYPYWEELLSYTTSLGISVAFSTNGSLVTEALVEKLKNFKIDVISTSIDTLKFDLFKQLRSDSKKSFLNTCKTPFLLDKIKIRKQINFVNRQSGINRDEFEEVFDYYKEAHIDLFFNLTECTYEERLLEDNNNNAYPLLLCRDFCDYIIQVDGNVVPCCFSASYPKDCSKEAYNIYDYSFSEIVDLFNKEFTQTHLNGLCSKCPAYCSKVLDGGWTKIHQGYFVLSDERQDNYVRIPKELSSLPENILLWLYRNNLVSKMKQEGILDY